MSAQWVHTTATPMLSAPTPAEAFSANAWQALREMVLFVQVCGVLAPATGISSVFLPYAPTAIQGEQEIQEEEADCSTKGTKRRTKGTKKKTKKTNTGQQLSYLYLPPLS